MDPLHEYHLNMTRRRFLGQAAGGVGIVALESLLSESLAAEAPGFSRDSARASDNPAGNSHNPARARRLLSIFQAGGPAQMELFDHKPELRQAHGKELPPSVRGTQRLTGFTANQGKYPVVASPFEFAPHGASGTLVSQLLPHLAGCVDDMCIIKSMHTEAINHDPAVTLLLTGSQVPGRPSLGAWMSYGLGSENSELPTFVVLLNPGKLQGAATPLSVRHWGSGFLSSHHQGVKFRSGSDPVLFLSNPPGIDRAARRRMLDAGAALNRIRYRAFGDPEINARIAQYEMAYRMQMSVPELTDVSGEPEHVFKLYGEAARTPGTYAANCLLARRLLEAGVRFVQIFDRDWDHHVNAPRYLRLKASETDQPTAALLLDLKRRGLLDDTLIVCGGEFGRTVYCQGPIKENYGRDHHGRCFTTWLAGGGVRGGCSVGATDDFCYNIARDPVHVHDLNATILHLLGIDHRQLTFRFQGRDHRLTDVYGEVITKLLA